MKIAILAIFMISDMHISQLEAKLATMPPPSPADAWETALVACLVNHPMAITMLGSICPRPHNLPKLYTFLSARPHRFHLEGPPITCNVSLVVTPQLEVHKRLPENDIDYDRIAKRSI